MAARLDHHVVTHGSGLAGPREEGAHSSSGFSDASDSPPLSLSSQEAKVCTEQGSFRTLSVIASEERLEFFREFLQCTSVHSPRPQCCRSI